MVKLKKSMKSFFGVFLIGAVLFVSSFVWGETFNSGLLQIRPYVNFKGMVDDNIYLEPENKQQSFISEVSPGVDFKMLVKTHFLSLGCHFDLVNYSEEAEKNDSQRQNIILVADFNFPDKAYLRLHSVFKDGCDPPTVELTERIKHKDTNIQAKVGVRTNKKIICELVTTYNSYLYEKDVYAIYDRNALCIGPVIFYKFLPRTSFLIEGNYGTIDYVTRSNSSGFFRLKGGLRKEVTPRFLLTIKAGVESRDYEEETIEDFSTIVFDMEMIEKFSEYSVFTLSAQSKACESFYLNNNYFNSTRGFLKFTQSISYKTTGSIGLGGYFNNYPLETTENNISQKRADFILEGTLGLDYKVQEWISLGLNHKYRKRDSNFDNYDYDNNQSSVNIEVSF
ncbi:outer membrane beta-barrel protein [bacterium]|nr:outer membrane beta-barrel protein [bacterium]